jgi:hypothetical protein
LGEGVSGADEEAVGGEEAKVSLALDGPQWAGSDARWGSRSDCFAPILAVRDLFRAILKPVVRMCAD